MEEIIIWQHINSMHPTHAVLWPIQTCDGAGQKPQSWIEFTCMNKMHRWISMKSLASIRSTRIMFPHYRLARRFGDLLFDNRRGRVTDVDLAVGAALSYANLNIYSFETLAWTQFWFYCTEMLPEMLLNIMENKINSNFKYSIYAVLWTRIEPLYRLSVNIEEFF